ncbi:hypothetical protein FB562_2227 [Homoserinimonas aerilata]|uniref:Uncharacterized protein n=1 Tax=Homoserinimonas aerilata TaxID=1162970 RepID=A0A542YF39_9MICO|nr:hypothetical protein [Homoserinimonas aerilata]TQL46703.1 hypothetical protein FB562_2227 [Homoserinimonas aerilata]
MSYGINPNNLRRESRRRRIESWASFWILLATCYVVLAIAVGALFIFNQLLKGTI